MCMFAECCQVCKTVMPEFKNLANTCCKPEMMTFICADCDLCKGTKDKFNIHSMPTFLIMKSGKVMCTINGPKMEELKSQLCEMLPGCCQ